MFIKRTDLALEARELWQESAERTTRLMGVKATKSKLEGYPVTRVDILDHRGEEALGKPQGSYFTIDLTTFWQRKADFFERAVRAVGTELKALLPVEGSALVVGLGNAAMTPDAVGPRALLLDGVAQVAAKDARLAAGIEDELTGLQRDFDDLAVLHHEHALAVVDGDDRAVGDDVVLAARVGAAATGAFAALAGQDVSRHRFAIDKFLPLVGHDAAGSSQSSFQESHGNLPFSSKAGWYWLDCLVVLVVFHDNGGLGVAEGVVLLGQVELAAVLVGVGGLVGRLELAYQ